MPTLLSILDSSIAHGLNQNSLRILLCVRDTKIKRPTDIAAKLKLTRASISSLVQDLCKSGHLQKTRDVPDDERSVTVAITDTGRHTLERIEHGITETPVPDP